jgi:hypothetical protein
MAARTHPGSISVSRCATRCPGVAENFVNDLQAAVSYAKDPPQSMPASGALYGSGQHPDGKGMLEQGMLAFIEATYDEV